MSRGVSRLKLHSSEREPPRHKPVASKRHYLGGRVADNVNTPRDKPVASSRKIPYTVASSERSLIPWHLLKDSSIEASSRKILHYRGIFEGFLLAWRLPKHSSHHSEERVPDQKKAHGEHQHASESVLTVCIWAFGYYCCCSVGQERIDNAL